MERRSLGRVAQTCVRQRERHCILPQEPRGQVAPWGVEVELCAKAIVSALTNECRGLAQGWCWHVPVPWADGCGWQPSDAAGIDACEVF